MSAHVALTAFRENLDSIDQHDNPTEWNLNRGLAALAEAIIELDNKLGYLQVEVSGLESKIDEQGPR